MSQIKIQRRLSFIFLLPNLMETEGGTSGQEPTCQGRRHRGLRVSSWVGKVPWRRAGQPMPVYLPRESPWTEEPGGYSPRGCKESDTTEATEHACIPFINLY